MILIQTFKKENNHLKEVLDHNYQLKIMIKHQHNLIFLEEKYLLNNKVDFILKIKWYYLYIIYR